MLVAQCQQLNELWKKAGFIKGKKTQESSRALNAKVALLQAKADTSSNDCLFSGENQKLITEISQPLTEREMATNRSIQTPDG